MPDTPKGEGSIKLITFAEAAPKARCSPAGLRAIAKRPGGPPIISVGRKKFLDADGFAAWLRAGGSK